MLTTRAMRTPLSLVLLVLLLPPLAAAQGCVENQACDDGTTIASGTFRIFLQKGEETKREKG